VEGYTRILSHYHPCSTYFADSFASSNLAEFDLAKNCSCQCGVSLTQIVIAPNKPAQIHKSPNFCPEIWAVRRDASKVFFASHSPVAKSHLNAGSAVPFLYNLKCCRNVCGGLAEILRGRTPQGLTPQKTLQNLASFSTVRMQITLSGWVIIPNVSACRSE